MIYEYYKYFSLVEKISFEIKICSLEVELMNLSVHCVN